MKKQTTDGAVQELTQRIMALSEALQAKNRRLTRQNRDLKEENALLRTQIQELENKRGVAEDDDSTSFVASSYRKHFHRTDCPWVQYISSPQEFSSHQEALDAGLKPCKTCRA